MKIKVIVLVLVSCLSVFGADREDNPEKDRIICVLLSSLRGDEQAARETWAHRCKDVVVAFPSIGYGFSVDPNNQLQLVYKPKKMWQFFNRLYRNWHLYGEWFVIASTNSYLDMDDVESLIARYNHSFPFRIGNVQSQTMIDYSYTFGGYVLNRKALELSGVKCSFDAWPEDGSDTQCTNCCLDHREVINVDICSGDFEDNAQLIDEIVSKFGVILKCPLQLSYLYNVRNMTELEKSLSHKKILRYFPEETKKKKILCVFLSWYDNDHVQAQNTWIKECDISVIAMQKHVNRSGDVEGKLIYNYTEMLPFYEDLYKEHGNDAGWFVIATHTTYLFMDGVRSYLDPKNSSLPLRISKNIALSPEEIDNAKGGYVLSRKALEILATECVKEEWLREKNPQRCTNCCMAENGVVNIDLCAEDFNCDSKDAKYLQNELDIYLTCPRQTIFLYGVFHMSDVDDYLVEKHRQMAERERREKMSHAVGAVSATSIEPGLDAVKKFPLGESSDGVNLFV